MFLRHLAVITRKNPMADPKTVTYPVASVEPMTDMEVRDAYDLRDQMLDLRNTIEQSVYRMGLLLLKAQEGGCWRAWGFDNLWEFAAAPVHSGGLGIGSRTASRFMRLAQFYIIDRKVTIDELNVAGHTKMDMMITVIKEREDALAANLEIDPVAVARRKKNLVERVLEDAQGLSAVDLMAKYVPKMRENNPAIQKMKENMSCPHCGKLYGGPRDTEKEEIQEADFTVLDDQSRGVRGDTDHRIGDGAGAQGAEV